MAGEVDAVDLLGELLNQPHPHTPIPQQVLCQGDKPRRRRVTGTENALENALSDGMLDVLLWNTPASPLPGFSNPIHVERVFDMTSSHGRRFRLA